MPSRARDDSFVFTDHDNHVSNVLWAATSGAGAGICFLVLSVIVVAMIHPVSRHHLDRVSFRIMIYALTANMVLGIASAVCGLQVTGGFTCGFSMWLLMLTLEISTFLLFCIALNLQLVLVHRINGQVMEKYYIVGSIAAALALTVPPYATGVYGWDPLNEACWYNISDTNERLRWQIGTQISWSIMCAFGEIICFLVVLSHLLRHQVLHGHASSRTRSGSLSVGSPGGFQRSAHAQTYRSVIIRISFYPLASLIINTVTSVSDIIMSTSDGVTTLTQYRILLLNDFCYGGRPIVYGLLAATDPSLLRAIRALYRHFCNRKDDSTGTSTGGGPQTHGATSNGQITVHIALKEVQHLDDGTQVISTRPIADSKAAQGGISVSDGKDYLSSNKDQADEESGQEDDRDEDSRDARLETMRRNQIGRALEARQEVIDFKQQREAFKRQI